MKGQQRFGTEVKGSVKCDGMSIGLLHTFVQEGQVYLSVGIQSTDHHTVGTRLDTGGNIVEYDVLLGFRIKEVTATRTDEYMMHQAIQGTYGTHQAYTRSKPSFAQTATEFHPVSTSLLGHLCTIVTAAADFKFLHDEVGLGDFLENDPFVLESEDTNKCWEARCISTKN